MPHRVRGIDIVFFDIGGYARSRRCERVDAVSRQRGVVARICETSSDCASASSPRSRTQLTNADAMAMLQQAGLAPFIDPQGFVSTTIRAASRSPAAPSTSLPRGEAGLPIDRCLFIGENLRRSRRRARRRHARAPQAFDALNSIE